MIGDATPTLEQHLEATNQTVDDLEARTLRALEEDLIAVPQVDTDGVATDLYRVVSFDGHEAAEYLVERGETCSCPDHQHREVDCKHLRHVALATRYAALPAPNDDATEYVDSHLSDAVAAIRTERSNLRRRVAALDRTLETLTDLREEETRHYRGADDAESTS